MRHGVYQEMGLLDSLLLPLQGLRCLTQRTAFSSRSSFMQLLLRYSNGTPESCILLHHDTVKLGWQAQPGMPHLSNPFANQMKELSPHA